jgi:hypothetical protein
MFWVKKLFQNPLQGIFDCVIHQRQIAARIQLPEIRCGWTG